MGRPTLLSWSSGKDSAWALHALRADQTFDVKGLVTTINAAFGRVAMHGTRRVLVECQAKVCGLPLHVIDLPWPCPNEAYEAVMAAFVERAVEDGIEAMAFGDLFLEDVRQYRVDRLEHTPIEPVFPVWGLETGGLARDMIGSGLGAIITCVDPKQLGREFAGRVFDQSFIDDLPANVDPCGENGEFHSFVTSGPMFSNPVPVKSGEVVERDGFVFADLLPEDGGDGAGR